MNFRVRNVRSTNRRFLDANANDELKPGMVDSLQNYLLPVNDEDTDIEEKRVPRTCLASLGTAKDYLGVQMSLGDVKKLEPKDVKKYYYRYQSILGKQVTGGLVENVIKLAVGLSSKIISIDDDDELSNDLLQDELIRRELTTAAGYFVLKGGRFVALASALFHVVKHIDFTTINKSIPGDALP